MKVFFLITALGLFFSCHTPIKEDDSLKNFIEANTKPDSGILRLDQFDKIKWNKLYIVLAYQGRSSFDENLKEYSSEILNTGIENNDGATIFALFYNDELVNITETGAPYNFHGIVKSEPNYKLGFYTKKDAVFAFKRDTSSLVKSFRPIKNSN